ncbi:hypothetical protein FRC14_005171 [Serendipita sp. 396]|nr:hypothetical protein FRC14_005171 [Serendipita sp. 396]KAG9058463.1 hypothetical protein FS842_009531 [Serendipita sp. 407]
MHLQSWSLLATTLAYLTAGTSAAGLAFNGANAPSQVLLLDDSWEKTADGSITTKKGELIVMGNITEYFLTWASSALATTSYGFTMDGHGINPFRDTGSITGTANVNGATWDSLQTGIRETQGDHQLKVWVANPAGVAFTAFKFMSSEGDTVFPSIYGRQATAVPSDALTIDSGSPFISFSPEGWKQISDCAFCDQRTLANSSTIGSWVQFTISGKSNPAFWVYGVKAERHSLANLRVTGYKGGSMAYDSMQDVVVGGFDNGEGSEGLVYQARLASHERLNEADYYTINMTLNKGALGIDFIRTTTEFITPNAAATTATPIGSPSSQNERISILPILLPTLLGVGLVALLVTGWCVWGSRFSAAAKKRREQAHVGTNGMVQVRHSTSSSTVASSPLDEKQKLPEERSNV